MAETPHEKAAGAVVRRYAAEPGDILLTIWHAELHEVIYQTPAASSSDSQRQRDLLLAAYADGQAFAEVLDNGFGKSYWRTDGDRYALWSYAMDITTVGTKAFHGPSFGRRV